MAEQVAGIILGAMSDDAPADASVDDYSCDLPGCDEATSFDVDDEAWPPAPPPGWFSIVVSRDGVRDVNLMYCSQPHLAAGVGEHLPDGTAVEDVHDWKDNLFVAAIVVPFFTVLALGLFTGATLLVALVGWVGKHL